MESEGQKLRQQRDNDLSKLKNERKQRLSIVSKSESSPRDNKSPVGLRIRNLTG